MENALNSQNSLNLPNSRKDLADLNGPEEFTSPFPELTGIDQQEGLKNTVSVVLYRKLLVKFRNRYTHFRTKFSAEQQGDDPTAAMRYAHTLKGNAAILGIHSVRAAALSLESAYQTQAAAEVIEEHIQAVQAALNPVLMALDVLD